MTPKKRWNIRLADNGSKDTWAAVGLLQVISLPLKSHRLALRAYNSGQGSSIFELFGLMRKGLRKE